ncbi:MAG TPA: response regulator [Verrucomicrobiae bacterium]|nr:response regulator [Verrucomicrobiae bacterium]
MTANTDGKSLILIVDDEAASRHGLEALLLHEGYRLALAADGPAALDKAALLRPDVILLDLTLPGMTGHEVCRRLRENPRLAETPVLALAQTRDEETRRLSLEAGADDLVTKPVDRAELRARLRTITRLHRYRRSLEERSRAEPIIELSPDGIIIVDERLEIRLINRVARSLLAAPADRSLAGMVLTALIPTMEGAAFKQRLQALLEGRETRCDLEATFVRFNGEPFPAEISAGLFPLEERNGVQLTLRDVAGRRKTQTEQARIDRLHSIGTLASGVAHDLNNCLTPVMGAAQMLEEEITSETGRALLKASVQAARKGATVLRQLQMFARGGEGERESLQLKYLMREVAQTLEQTFPRSIRVETRVPAGLPLVRGDSAQLRQVLMSLCLNAREAMPDGGVISLEARAIPAAEAAPFFPPGMKPVPCMRMTVADNGRGMPPEVAGKIFEPFFTSKPAGSGAGLGLSTALGIVRSHGGFVQVESVPGKGTRIHVSLPAVEEPEQAAAPEPGQIPRGKGELVLVVDDEPAIRQICQTALERHGYQALVAADGATAVGLCASYQATLRVVLVDAVMPVLDGPATLRALARVHPAARVVVMCGWLERDHFQGTPTGPKPVFLTKPFDVWSLLASVREALALSPAPAPASANGHSKPD